MVFGVLFGFRRSDFRSSDHFPPQQPFQSFGSFLKLINGSKPGLSNYLDLNRIRKEALLVFSRYTFFSHTIKEKLLGDFIVLEFKKMLLYHTQIIFNCENIINLNALHYHYYLWVTFSK